LVSVTLSPHVKNLESFLTHCHRRRYPAKSTIIYAGDKSDSLYYIIKGSVTVLIEDEEGRIPRVFIRLGHTNGTPLTCHHSQGG